MLPHRHRARPAKLAPPPHSGALFLLHPASLCFAQATGPFTQHQRLDFSHIDGAPLAIFLAGHEAHLIAPAADALPEPFIPAEAQDRPRLLGKLASA